MYLTPHISNSETKIKSLLWKYSFNIELCVGHIWFAKYSYFCLEDFIGAKFGKK